jgi:WD40 repeat protein
MKLELMTPVRRWLAHRDAIFDLCFAMEDRRMLTGSGDYSVCYWDTETTSLLSTFRGHVGSVKGKSFFFLFFFFF